jgi:hypothetical protein
MEVQLAQQRPHGLALVGGQLLLGEPAATLDPEQVGGRAARDHPSDRFDWQDQAARYSLGLDTSHLHGLTRSPMTGVIELIWNAIDADATTIEVDLLRTEMGGVHGIVVRDDGHGITPQLAAEQFAKLGGHAQDPARSVTATTRRRAPGPQRGPRPRSMRGGVTVARGSRHPDRADGDP